MDKIDLTLKSEEGYASIRQRAIAMEQKLHLLTTPDMSLLFQMQKACNNYLEELDLKEYERHLRVYH